MSENRIPVIIDTDPGVDDVMAIMIAAASEKIELVGITPVDGNVSARYTHRNALDLVDWLGLDVPVAEGSYEQLVYRFGRYSGGHGANGLGGVKLPESHRQFHELRAWDFIYEKAKEYGGRLELICIGPLTNIARTLILHPDLPKYVKRINLMGGSVTAGNVTPYAEFNFIVDPPAAKMVFGSGIPIVMAGLNVTQKTGISFRFIEGLAEQSGAKIASLFRELIHGYKDVDVNKEGDRSSVIHDAIPVAYVIDPTRFTTEPCRITIDTHRFLEGEWGRSVPHEDGEPNATVITDIDMDYYRSLYAATVEKFKGLE